MVAGHSVAGVDDSLKPATECPATLVLASYRRFVDGMAANCM